MRNTRVAGHTLSFEGDPHFSFTCPDCTPHRALVDRCRISGYAASGHGLCSCGEMSPHLYAKNERKRWHARHKDALRDAEATA